MKNVTQRMAGFTLLELMMVVAIIGLVVAMGVPAILSVTHEEPLRKTVQNVTDICFNARAEAIQYNKMTVVAFYPVLKKIELVGGVDSSVALSRLGQKPVTSVQFDQSVDVDELDINIMNFTTSPEAFVRFYPNGTCDEMYLALKSGTQYRKITLDPVTALASVGLVR